MDKLMLDKKKLIKYYNKFKYKDCNVILNELYDKSNTIDIFNENTISYINERLYDFNYPLSIRNYLIKQFKTSSPKLLQELDKSKIDWEVIYGSEDNWEFKRDTIINTYENFVKELVSRYNDVELIPTKSNFINFSKTSKPTDTKKINTTLSLYIKNSEREGIIEDIMSSNLVSKYKLQRFGNNEFGVKSSVGGIGFEIEDVICTFVFKGDVKGEGTTDTDEKEGLVVLFFNVKDLNISSIEEDNFANVITQLLHEIDGINGITNETKAKLEVYLSTIENVKQVRNTLNQALSISNLLRSKYDDFEIIRTNAYKNIREIGSKLTKVPPDKWNPSDIYLINPSQKSLITTQLKKSLEYIQDTQLALDYINDLFVDNFGDRDKPIVGISLKESRSQMGKSKSMLKSITKDGYDYNLTKDEVKLSRVEKQEIMDEWRKNISSNLKKVKNVNIIYNYDNKYPKKDNTFDQKFGSLKLLNFLSNNVNISPDTIFASAAAFGMGATGLNPTFFVLTGKISGKASILKFDRNDGVTLSKKLITIEDKSTNGGILISLELNMGEIKLDIVLNIRSNGTSQVTMENRKVTLI